MAKRDPIEDMAIALHLEALDAAAQGRKHVRACAHHGAAPTEILDTAETLNEPAAGSFVHDMF
jgi:hypothetical protein